MTEPSQQQLVTADLAALYIQQTFGFPIAPATIRSWAHRGRITSHNGRYDLEEIHKRIDPDSDDVA